MQEAFTVDQHTHLDILNIRVRSFRSILQTQEGELHMNTSPSASVADEIAKLNKLWLDGAISDAEFQQQKERLLGSNSAPTSTPSAPARSDVPTDWSSVRLRNKWWFQAVLTLLIIPVGIILMLSCTAYHKKRGQIVRVGKGAKFLLITIALLLWAFNVAKLMGPYNLGRAAGGAYSIIHDAADSTAAPGDQNDGSLAACDGDDTKAAVKQILEQDGQTKVVDMGGIQEVSCPALNMDSGACMKPSRKERYCNAQVYLSTGTTGIKFHMSYGPSGKPLVEVQEGAWTDWSKMK
jgi:hypothetical protein